MAPKQTPFRLPKDIRDRLEAEAKRLDLSLNAVLVMYLDRSLPPLSAAQSAPPAAEPEPKDDDTLDWGE